MTPNPFFDKYHSAGATLAHNLNTYGTFVRVQSPTVSTVVANISIQAFARFERNKLFAALGFLPKVENLGRENVVVIGIIDKGESDFQKRSGAHPVFSAWICYPERAYTSDDAFVVLTTDGDYLRNRLRISEEDIPGPTLLEMARAYSMDHLRFPGTLPLLLVESDEALWEILEEAGTDGNLDEIHELLEAQARNDALTLQNPQKEPEPEFPPVNIVTEPPEFEPLPEEVSEAVSLQLEESALSDAVISDFLESMGVSTFAIDDESDCVVIDKSEFVRNVISTVRREKDVKLGLSRVLAYTEHADKVQDTDYIMDKVAEDIASGRLKCSVDVPVLTYNETVSALRSFSEEITETAE